MEFPTLVYGRKKVWGEQDGAARLVDGRGFWIGPEGRGHDIAEVHCTASQTIADQEEWAKLFVAAPLMLDALRHIATFPRTSNASVEALKEVAREAIRSL